MSTLSTFPTPLPISALQSEQAYYNSNLDINQPSPSAGKLEMSVLTSTEGLWQQLVQRDPQFSPVPPVSQIPSSGNVWPCTRRAQRGPGFAPSPAAVPGSHKAPGIPSHLGSAHPTPRQAQPSQAGHLSVLGTAMALQHLDLMDLL